MHWRDSAAAQETKPDEDGSDITVVKEERRDDEGRQQQHVKEEAIKQEIEDEKEAPHPSTDGTERATLRATIKGSQLRRRRDGGEKSELAVVSDTKEAADIEPRPALPPRPLLRASSRGQVRSSTSNPSSPPASHSPSSSSSSAASSPSSTSRQPAGMSRMLSRSSTRNLFASLSKGVAMFSSNQTHGAAEEDDEANREWLMRRLSKHDEPLDPPSAASATSSAAKVNANASWLTAHWYVFTFCRERVFPSLLVLLVLIQLIVLPLRLALSLELANWWLYDRLLDVLYVLIVLFTDYVQVDVGADTPKDGEASVPSPHSKVSIHLRSSLSRRMFFFDILSTLPYYLFIPSSSLATLFVDPTHATAIRLESLLHLPRILRAPRLSSFMEQLELFNLVQSIISPAIFRLLSFGVWMYLFAHFAGCAWWLTSYIEGLPDDDFVVQADMREGSFGKVYLHLLFVGFKCMTGGAPNPSTTLEHVFTLLVSLIGLSIYGLLVGSLTSIISNMNSKQDEFRQKMELITALMESNQLPADVQTRVKLCMRYLYGYGSDERIGSGDRHRGNEGWDVLNVLPAYLRNELLCYVNGDIMRKVPLFRDCSDGFMRSLVPLLTPEVVIPGPSHPSHTQCAALCWTASHSLIPSLPFPRLPMSGDLLIREGEIGREMYLLRRGQLDVIAHGQRVASLTSGGFVGEVCLLWEGTKRTASVQAVTFCDVLVLKKEDFDSVVAEYPEVQRRMKIEATMRKNARTLQDQQLKGGTEGAESEKHEAGDRLRALVREGSLQLKRASAASSPASTPQTSAPPTPSATPPTSAAPLRAASTRRRTVDNADAVPHLMQVLASVKQNVQGEEGEVDRRHTMPTVSGDGVLQGSGSSVARAKWQKLRLLTKGMGS